MCFTFLIQQYADPQENNRSYFRFVLYITQIRSGLFFGRFEGNSILTKNAETRILLQNSICLFYNSFFQHFYANLFNKIFFVMFEAVSTQGF